MKKRITAILLTLVMLLGMAPTTVFALEDGEPSFVFVSTVPEDATYVHLNGEDHVVINDDEPYGPTITISNYESLINDSMVSRYAYADASAYDAEDEAYTGAGSSGYGYKTSTAYTENGDGTISADTGISCTFDDKGTYCYTLKVAKNQADEANAAGTDLTVDFPYEHDGVRYQTEQDAIDAGWAPTVATIGDISYPTIAAALDAAVKDDVITLEAGPHSENITISKAITLQGAGEDNTTLTGKVEITTTPTTGAATLEDLTVDNDGGAYHVNLIGTDDADGNGCVAAVIKNVTIKAGGTYHSHIAILAGAAYNDHDVTYDVTVENVTFENKNNVTVYRNIGVATECAAKSTQTSDCKLTVTNCEFNEATYGIDNLGASTVSITGNTFPNTSSGVQVFINNDSDVTITGNTFTDNSYGIKATVFNIDAATIENNTFEGSNILVAMKVEPETAYDLYTGNIFTDNTKDNVVASTYLVEKNDSATVFSLRNVATLKTYLGIFTNATIYISDDMTLTESLTIGAGQTIIVEEGATLTVPSEVILTNNGAIVNNGTITGDVEVVATINDIEFGTLTAAIAAAEAGDTIIVHKNVADKVIINKSDITLKAAEDGVTLEKGVGFQNQTADDPAEYDNVTIDGFTIPVGLAVNEAGYSVSNLTISNNIITGQLLLADANGSDANPHPCKSAEILNNTVTAVKADGVIKARNLESVLISGNTVTADVENASGIMAWYCDDAQITNNTIITAKYAGINVTDSAGSVLNNTIQAYGTQEGTQYALIFSLVEEGSVVVKNNDIAYIEGEGGILVQDGSYVDATGNNWNTTTPVALVSDGSGDQGGINYGEKSTLIIEKTTTESTDSQKVENLVGSVDETSSAGTVNATASTVVDVVTNVTDAHKDTTIVESVNTLDDLFVAANGNISVDADLTALPAEGYTIEDAKVAGLAIAVYGGAVPADTVELTLEVKQVESADDVDLAFTATPYVSVNNGENTKVENEDLNAPVTFKIYLPETFEGNRATVVHENSVGTEVDTYTLSVLTDENDDKYIQITVTEFSTFHVTGYTYTSSGGTAYYTSSVASTENGDVTLSGTRNKLNAAVTITATPDEGYEVADVAVTYAQNGREVTVTDNGDGTYSYKQPGATVTVTVTFAEIEVEYKNPFTDVVDGAYYYDAVKWAVAEGVTSGTSNTTFSPDATCTRAQAVTFLYRAAGSPEVTGECVFTDVDADSYYYDAVLWAVSEGITTGTSDTTFSPDSVCSRSQIVTFLYRAAGEPEATGDGVFTDVSADDYYSEAVLWAVGEEITTGTSNTTFSPISECTRGQIVTFLYRNFNA